MLRLWFEVALWGGVVLAFLGCSTTPQYIRCKGDGTFTIAANAMAVYGGTLTITTKCGEGIFYEQRKYAPKDNPS